MEFGYWEENYHQWKMFTENNIRSEWEANIFFNFDRFGGHGGNVWFSPGFGYEQISETEDYRIIRDGNGLFEEISKKGGSSIPRYIKSSIETPDDWLKIKKERLNRDDPSRKVNIDKLKEAIPDNRDYPVSVSTGSMIGKIRDTLTFEGLAYATYDYPEMVEDMVETACVLVEDYLDQVLPHVHFDCASGWEDICFKNGPIVSVDFFRDIVMPRYKRIHKKLENAGIDIWYVDCDGDVRPIMKFFLESGINCLFPFEVNCCAHPAELLDSWGKELRIMGGVDKMKMAESKEAIDKYLDSLIPLVKRGGYIPFCDHRCPPNVSEENYIYYLDRKEQLFSMK
jgi:uroporphyrinogen decarboxylase